MRRQASRKAAILPPVTRRDFLANCAGCMACAPAIALTADSPRGAAQTASVSAPSLAAKRQLDEKTRLRLVFAHPSRKETAWPYQGYDYEGRKKELTTRLCEACPNVEFLPAAVASAGEAETVLANGEQVDGHVVYIIGTRTQSAVDAFIDSGRPILLVDDLYGGTGVFVLRYAEACRKGLKVAGVASSRFEDVTEAVKAFEALRKMRASVILDIIDGQPGEHARGIEEAFGTQVRKTGAEELNAAYRQADRALAKEYAEKWLREAREVVEPTREEVEKSALIYVGMRDLMKQQHAQAITVDCLSLVYGKKLPAYPCLGFFQLNNDGHVGACEADLQSTLAMLLMGYLVGRPGYISDPVIDTSLNRIIYAHCVAPNRVFGPAGQTNPYDIRSHSEDRKGAAIRSLMPLGEIVTTLKIHPGRRELAIHQAKTVENVDEEKACRTKLAAEVGDAKKLLSGWNLWGMDYWSWHRTTFFGDHKRAVETVSTLAGFKVIWES
jgi:hypothetical protein